MPCVAQEAQKTQEEQVPAETTLDLTAEASNPVPKRRATLLTPSQVLSKQLAHARMLERATVTQRRLQTKTWAAKPPKGSVNKWQPPKGKKPAAKPMPPSFPAPKPPAARPKPPAMPRQGDRSHQQGERSHLQGDRSAQQGYPSQGDQEKVLWHIDFREPPEQNSVLRLALFPLKSRQQPQFLILSSLVQLVMRPAVGATVVLITSCTQDHTIRNWAVWDRSVEKVPAGGRQQRQL